MDILGHYYRPFTDSANRSMIIIPQRTLRSELIPVPDFLVVMSELPCRTVWYWHQLTARLARLDGDCVSTPDFVPSLILSQKVCCYINALLDYYLDPSLLVSTMSAQCLEGWLDGSSRSAFPMEYFRAKH
jgi:hypothetical protein